MAGDGGGGGDGSGSGSGGGGGLLDLERELTCSICTDVLYQPLTLLAHLLRRLCQGVVRMASDKRRQRHPAHHSIAIFVSVMSRFRKRHQG
jgi:hypothetical protein